MTDTVISVEHLSKHYRLGTIGGRTLRDDLARAWAQLRRQPDPLLKVGQENHGNHDGETIWALRDVRNPAHAIGRQGDLVRCANGWKTCCRVGTTARSFFGVGLQAVAA